MTDEEIDTVREELGLDQQSDDLANIDDQFEMLEAGRQATVTDRGSKEREYKARWSGLMRQSKISRVVVACS